jgi:hypothetical protein
MKLARADYQSAAGCHPASHYELSIVQAAFHSAYSIREEFLGLRCTILARHEAGEIVRTT